MLHGFGLYPVSLQIDIDSYDGDWRHVERFRNRCGWLTVAEAKILIDHECRAIMHMVVGCDEREEAIPSFIAANLLACATSHPEPCYELPPDVLNDLVEHEKVEVRKRWLRENIAAIAAIHDQAEQAILELEAKAKRHTRKSERKVTSLRRQRRFLAPEDPRRAMLTDAITDEEAWQEQVIDWLADRRAQLRQHFDRLERQASRGLRPRISVETLYVVQWQHRPAPSTQTTALVAELVRDTWFWPQQPARVDLSDDQLATLAKLGRQSAWASTNAPATEGHSPPPPTTPLPRNPRRPCVPPTAKASGIESFMRDQLAGERAILAAKLENTMTAGRKFFPGSRKFNANREEQTRLRGQIARLDRRIRAIGKTARLAKRAETGRTKQDLADVAFGRPDDPPRD